MRRAFDGYEEWFRASASPEHAPHLTEQLERLDGKRAGFQEQAAQDPMSLDELRARLIAIDEEKALIRDELRRAQGDARLAEDTRRLRDLLLEGIERGYYRHRPRTPEHIGQLFQPGGVCRYARYPFSNLKPIGFVAVSLSLRGRRCRRWRCTSSSWGTCSRCGCWPPWR